MNKLHLSRFLLAAVILFSCNNDSNTTTAADSTDETPNAANQGTASKTNQGDDIVGEWKMTGFVQDTNNNLQIDEDERKNLKPVSFEGYMKLNGDGSGLFTTQKMEGRYEMTDDPKGKKMIWLDKANGSHRIGTVVKVSKEELHIKEPGGNGLFVWKRI